MEMDRLSEAESSLHNSSKRLKKESSCSWQNPWNNIVLNLTNKAYVGNKFHTSLVFFTYNWTCPDIVTMATLRIKIYILSVLQIEDSHTDGLA